MSDLIRAVVVQTDHFSQDMQLEECEQKLGDLIYRFRRPTNVSSLESFVRFFSDIFGGVTKAKDSLCGSESKLPQLINIKGQNLQIARDPTSNCIWGSIRNDKQAAQSSPAIAITFLRVPDQQPTASKNVSTVITPPPPAPPPPPPPPDISKLNANLSRAYKRGNGPIGETTTEDSGKQKKIVSTPSFAINSGDLTSGKAALKKPDQRKPHSSSGTLSPETTLAQQMAEKLRLRRLAIEGENEPKTDEGETWNDVTNQISASSQPVKPPSPT